MLKNFNNVLKFHYVYVTVPQFCFQMLRKSPLIYCVLSLSERGEKQNISFMD